VLKFKLTRIVLLIPVGGVLWWTLSWYTRLGFFHPMWISALTAFGIDYLIIRRQFRASLSDMQRRALLIATIETAIAAVTFAVALGIFKYFTLPPPEA
jgi:hypothetical protein